MVAVDLNRPLETPPSGVHANFENPPNEAILAYATLAVALSMVTLFAWFRYVASLTIRVSEATDNLQHNPPDFNVNIATTGAQSKRPVFLNNANLYFHL